MNNSIKLTTCFRITSFSKDMNIFINVFCPKAKPSLFEAMTTHALPHGKQTRNGNANKINYDGEGSTTNEIQQTKQVLSVFLHYSKRVKCLNKCTCVCVCIFQFVKILAYGNKLLMGTTIALYLTNEDKAITQTH